MAKIKFEMNMDGILAEFKNAGLATNPMHWSELRGYLTDGFTPSNFLKSLLENDLSGFARTASEFDAKRLRNWDIFMYTALPPACHGSPEKVKAWLDGEFRKWDMDY